MSIAYPLVSVVVITYNSENYIVETLESIKAQKYHNIELIISDDASPDNTVEKCKNWVAAHSSRFVRTQIIVSERNSGTAGNCNRGINVAAGKWIKIIAGDDVLLDNCISDNIQYILSNREAKLVVSSMNAYQDKFVDNNFRRKTPLLDVLPYFDLDSAGQYDKLFHKGNFIPAPSVFMLADTIRQNNLFDERFPLMEDYPMWLKLTKKGNKFYFMNEVTINYRLHSGSVQLNNKRYPTIKNATQNIFFLKTFFEGNEAGFKTKKEIFRQNLIILFNKVGLNRSGFLSKVIFYLIGKL